MTKTKEHSIKDAYITVTGRFKGIPIYDLKERLIKMGARIDNVVSKRTKYCFMGKGTKRSKIVERSALLGTEIINHDQTLDFLKGSSLTKVIEAGRQEVDVIEQDELLAELRTVLSLSHVDESWREVCALLDRTPSDQLEVATQYILHHTDAWDFSVDFTKQLSSQALAYVPCGLPKEWHPLLFSKEDDPRLKVVRTLNLHKMRLPMSYFRPLQKAESLANVRYADLSNNGITNHTLKLLKEAPFLRNLHYLGLASINTNDHKHLTTLLKDWLLSPHLSSLRMLDISGTELSQWVTSDAMGHLALTHLNLSNNRLHKVFFERFIDAPHLRGLRCLMLSGMMAEHGSLPAFLEAASFDDLTYLTLDQLLINAEHLALIATNPSFRNLKHLSLVYNDLRQEELRAFLAHENMKALKSINVAVAVMERDFDLDALQPPGRKVEIKTNVPGY